MNRDDGRADAGAAEVTLLQADRGRGRGRGHGSDLRLYAVSTRCRHLVADRLDITGARWGLDGAEAVLQLRALRSNGDFDDYWTYHQTQERQRVHTRRYANNVIPEAA